MILNVFVSGSFDTLHSGHITFLKEAAKYGCLHVGIGSDKSIKKLKGHPTICKEQERLFMVRSIRYVHEAWINSGEGALDFKKDLLAAGINELIVNEDQHSEEKEQLCNQLRIRYVILQRTQEPGLPVRSSTSMRKYYENR